MTAKEEVSANVHSVIYHTIDGFSFVSSRLVADQNHVVAKGLDDFNPATDELLKYVEVMRDVTQYRVFLIADEQDLHVDLLLSDYQQHYRIGPNHNSRSVLLNANPSRKSLIIHCKYVIILTLFVEVCGGITNSDELQQTLEVVD